ncbi:MAG TPA: citramalate synthase [Clostridiales bacterium]|nr:citramalate synthase [Clostridiales bacterium]
MRKRINVLDSTLRDGAQGEGISFSVSDKLNIVKALDQLGVTYIEAGNPGSNPKDQEFFAEIAQMELKHARLSAFGSTRRKNTETAEDRNIQALVRAGTPTVVIFGKCWELHVREILSTTLEENLAMIRDTVAFFKGLGKEVIFDGEHFFDGYAGNPEYALSALGAAVEAGADSIVLCDTNGGAFPSQVYEITRQVVERFPKGSVGIHCHNDGGMAVANSIMAVEAGADQIQGTYLGYGERCGNANLSTLIPNLQIKKGFSVIPDEKLEQLTPTARYIAEVSNIVLDNAIPYVGSSAFAHKAGMHADGVLKTSASFEHIHPSTVGNERRFLMSEIAGRTALLNKISAIRPDITKDSKEIQQIMEILKEREHRGYQYEAAESSLEILVRKHLGKYRPFFELINFKILGEQPAIDGCSATATIKVMVDGQTQISAAEGDGPVHALDRALRKALGVFYPALSQVHLTDYKVRVMEPKEATAAKVRVLIQSTDGVEIWSTVGVSTDIIEASWLALVDSIEYKLTRDIEKKVRKNI